MKQPPTWTISDLGPLYKHIINIYKTYPLDINSFLYDLDQIINAFIGRKTFWSFLTVCKPVRSEYGVIPPDDFPGEFLMTPASFRGLPLPAPPNIGGRGMIACNSALGWSCSLVLGCNFEFGSGLTRTDSSYLTNDPKIK